MPTQQVAPAQTLKNNGHHVAPILSNPIMNNNNNCNNNTVTNTPNTPGSRSRVSYISNASTETFTNNNMTAINIDELPPPLPAKEKKTDNLYIKNKHMQSPVGNKNKVRLF